MGYEAESASLKTYHNAEWPNYHFVRAIEPINFVDEKTPCVIIGFDKGQLVVYDLANKKTLCESKVAYESPRLDVFKQTTVTDEIFFCSAWFNMNFFTIHVIRPATKEIAELDKVNEDLPVQRVKSVVIGGVKHVLYAGDGFVGLFNMESGEKSSRAFVPRADSCAYLGVIGYGYSDFLIMFYNDDSLNFLKYEGGELRFVTSHQDSERLCGSYTNSCCLWMNMVEGNKFEILVSKHDDEEFMKFSKLTIRINV
eukprot:TRINITY_DN10695_c0_g1_i2.p1 TRINITY_DN10695_c0_g1~~TRINITY_DN10695_c0_g1_i2.p1  ORF type:complete len:254 (+),score=25.50 TRINITY_DN10695_c0_g1_i2:337-1098(+)